MIKNWNVMKKLDFNDINNISMKISLVLTLVPGCNNNWCTISEYPLADAKIKGVLLNYLVIILLKIKIDLNILAVLTIDIKLFASKNLLNSLQITIFWCLEKILIFHMKKKNWMNKVVKKIEKKMIIEVKTDRQGKN